MAQKQWRLTAVVTGETLEEARAALAAHAEAAGELESSVVAYQHDDGEFRACDVPPPGTELHSVLSKPDPPAELYPAGDYMDVFLAIPEGACLPGFEPETELERRHPCFRTARRLKLKHWDGGLYWGDLRKLPEGSYVWRHDRWQRIDELFKA